LNLFLFSLLIKITFVITESFYVSLRAKDAV